MADVNDRQIVKALSDYVSAQLGTAVSPKRLVKALRNLTARADQPDVVLVSAGRWLLTDGDGGSHYIAEVGTGAATRAVELCVSATQAALMIYAGQSTGDPDSPLAGRAYYAQESVDRSLVADSALAWPWVEARLLAGLPAVP